MTKKTTTKARIKPVSPKVNAVDFGSGEFASPVMEIERWKVGVLDTSEYYYGPTKADALNYIARKGATHFSLKLIRLPVDVLVD